MLPPIVSIFIATPSSISPFFPFASMHPNVNAKYHSDVLLQPHGNSASANMDYAPTMTPLPILDSDV
jgi:hypothetical protein